MINFVCFIITPSLLIAWLVSEFKTASRSIRCTLGLLAILSSCFGVAQVTGFAVRLQYNAWYSGAYKTLLDATVDKLKSGESEDVLQELRIMQKKFHPQYESRANFDELARDTAIRIRADK